MKGWKRNIPDIDMVPANITITDSDRVTEKNRFFYQTHKKL